MKTYFKDLFIILFFINVLSSFLICQNDNNFSSNNLDSIQILEKAISVLPHPRQYEWQKNEFTAFIHFGVNTFSGREWGTGFEDPKIFNPTNLDTDQWCEAIKAAGMKLVILTVKHHDGFCLWQTRYTDHSVASTDWLNGQGDVLRELSKSCEKYDLKLGVYLSPADLYQIENENGLYGNLSEYSLRTIPRKIDGKPFKDQRTFEYLVDDYNEYFMNQLFELLTEYGTIHEVWFDGAHPKRKGGQKYTYQQWYDLIRKIAPEAVIFGKGPDVRWCGNEAGNTRESEWSVIPIDGEVSNWTWPDLIDDDLGSFEKIEECLNNGGTLHWYPAETNTSIREGWFWRDEEQRVKSAEEILDIWYRSVGGNTVFLLNIPPNNQGLFSERDVNVLKKVGKKISEVFKNNLIVGAKAKADSEVDENHKAENVLDGNLNTCWMPKNVSDNYSIKIQLPKKVNFNRIVLQEQIQDYSQRIVKFNIDVLLNNNWLKIFDGTTIGYKKICRIPTLTSDQIRINITDSRLAPTINNIGLYFEEVDLSNPIISRNKEGFVNIKCLNPGPQIKYTIDGTEPNINSKIFIIPFKAVNPVNVKAFAFDINSDKKSEIVYKRFDIAKTKWKVIDYSSIQRENHEDAYNAIDDDENTHWMTEWKNQSPEHPHFITIDLGEEVNLKGFAYTPRNQYLNGTLKNYKFYLSSNGSNWNLVSEGEFSNIKNNPVEQRVYFSKSFSAKFIKFEALDEINGKPWTSAAEIGVITE